MIPAHFDYHRAASVEEALDLLGRLPDAKLLAGGHSLLPMMKLRLAQPAALVDIGRIAELSGIARRGDGAVHIGALTRHGDIAASELLADACPLVARAAAEIGDPQVRNRGTLGGNIAHADPASDLPAALVAVGATVEMRGPRGSRSVAAADFFVDLLTTDLAADEILTGVEIAWRKPGTGSAYHKVEHPASGYATCGAAAVVSVDGSGAPTSAALCFNGVAATPVSAPIGESPDDWAATLATWDVEDPLGDIHASGEYRVHLARVHGRRALEAALAEARGAR